MTANAPLERLSIAEVKTHLKRTIRREMQKGFDHRCPKQLGAILQTIHTERLCFKETIQELFPCEAEQVDVVSMLRIATIVAA